MNRLPRCLCPWLVFLAVAASFAYVAQCGFVAWDDDLNVYENPYLNPVTAGHTLDFWRHTTIGKYQTYRPVVYTAYAGIALVSRLNVPRKVDGGGIATLDPRPFHVANLLLQAANALLVFFVLRLIFENDWAAACGALLFGLHPVQVEPVAWITGMSDTLAGLFGLLALWRYLLYARAVRDDASARRFNYWLSIGFYLLALLAKPNMVALPLVAWILDCVLLKRPVRMGARALAPWFALAVCGVLWTKLAEPLHDQSLWVPWWQRPFVAGDALAFYGAKLLAPWPLCMDYGRAPQWVLGHWWGYCTWIFPAVFLFVALRYGRRHPALFAAVAVFLVAVAPNLGFLPFRYQSFSTVADRYLYLAMLGPALGLAWALSRARGRWPWGVALAVLIAYAGLTVRQTLYWRDSSTLFGHALELYPESGFVNYNLATTLLREGKLDDAMARYRIALRVQPGLSDAHYNLGVLLAMHGDAAGAEREFRATLSLRPDDAYANYNLGRLLVDQGEIGEAIACYNRAVQAEPDKAEMHNSLGIALARNGDVSGAESEFETAIRLKPGYAEAHFDMGLMLRGSGRMSEAMREWRTALQCDPNFAPARQALGESNHN